MFDNDMFTEDQGIKRTRAGDVAGGIGLWGLHLAAVFFAIYSGYHGISATAQYRAAAGLGMAAGIVGIVVIELVIMSIYLGWHNSRFVGAPQMIAAGVTFGIGFVLASLGIVADSQLNAGIELSGWLSFYLTWGLPLAPAIMALGAVLIHELAPAQGRARQETEDRDMVEAERFNAYLAGLRAETAAARAVQRMQLNARQQAAQQIAAWYSSDQAQKAITATALKDAPRMLRQIGIDVDQAGPGPVEVERAEDMATITIPELEEMIRAGKVPAPPPVHSANGNGAGVASAGKFRGGE